ncbi:hypothetical protein K435DRAFT_785819 [Dendrothele bispora CBS 962.96]|uniref:Uncharacterized protein n=1 Tax=Dendrothele bispora (strain CBS 962.96) TaxID=1314807 RepID=A0A4S8KUT1_DENBC|nr:hypothetical protein K435DRAFT_785819 [Dendrothele bispora CBS 962.96]
MRTLTSPRVLAKCLTNKARNPQASYNHGNLSMTLSGPFGNVKLTQQRTRRDYKHPVLPPARIKKVMKMDPDVKVISRSLIIVFGSTLLVLTEISADAPILLCKACETLFTLYFSKKSSYPKSPPAPSSYPTLTNDTHSPAPISPLPYPNLINSISSSTSYLGI